MAKSRSEQLSTILDNLQQAEYMLAETADHLDLRGRERSAGKLIKLLKAWEIVSQSIDGLGAISSFMEDEGL